MKRIKSFFKLGVLGVFCAIGMTFVAGNAYATGALDLSSLSVDTGDYKTIATFLITALVGFWGIKKGLGLLGR